MAQERWEYLTLELHLQRGPLGGIVRWYWQDAPDEHFAPEDRRGALRRLNDIGDDGWELVAVTSLSFDFGAGGLSGATSDLEYTFKRPR